MNVQGLSVSRTMAERYKNGPTLGKRISRLSHGDLRGFRDFRFSGLLYDTPGIVHNTDAGTEPSSVSNNRVGRRELPSHLNTDSLTSLASPHPVLRPGPSHNHTGVQWAETTGFSPPLLRSCQLISRGGDPVPRGGHSRPADGRA